MSERNERNKRIIDEFHANQGKVGGPFEGRALLLLHTSGAKSQQERINPVAYTKDGNRFVVIASKCRGLLIPTGNTISLPTRW